MGYYEVAGGDCLSSIAKEFGFPDYKTIYQHPSNAEFRQKRPNPNIIFPGDVLFIPDVRLKVVTKATDQRHKFHVKRPHVLLRLCLQDDLRRPYKNVKYHLRVDFDFWDGTTDAGGMVEQEIPADAQGGEITIFPSGDNAPDQGYTFSLQLGELDPPDETSGVDARLINLGFGPPDAEDSLCDEDRRAALAAFQEEFGLEVTGEADAQTESKLRQLHDGE